MLTVSTSLFRFFSACSFDVSRRLPRSFSPFSAITVLSRSSTADVTSRTSAWWDSRLFGEDVGDAGGESYRQRNLG